MVTINHKLQKGPSVADSVIGEGNTTTWKLCGLDKSTCLTVLFDLSSSDHSNTPTITNPQLYLQFLTRLCLKFLMNGKSYLPCCAIFPFLHCWSLNILVMFILQLPESKRSISATGHHYN